MAKKTKNSKDELPKDYKFKSPKETLRSKGSFYVRKSRTTKDDGSSCWTLYLETYQDGKPNQQRIHGNLYYKFGLKSEMHIDQARSAIKDYNRIRKAELKVDYDEAKAVWRNEKRKEINKIIFPPNLVEEFETRLLSSSDGKKKFKQRIIRCFEIVQKMTGEYYKLLPHDYESSVDLFANYFKKQQYSVSYSKDILWVLSKWGSFYSRKTNKFYQPFGKLKTTTQNAISEAREDKVSVRRESKPMTEALIKQMGEKIKSRPYVEAEEVHKLNWLKCSFYFGLRPSECDAVLEKREKAIEKKDGIEILVAIQTKLTVVNKDEREKRIPVICPQQEEALEYIKNGQAKRPNPKWVSKNLEGLKEPTDHYDLYSGRKGFTDFMLEEKIGQSLENISLYLGHKSISTTWKTYKNRRKVDFKPTEFTKLKKTG